MIRRILIFDLSRASPAVEREVEEAFLCLPARIPAIRRYVLGRNTHPMRPDLWMCTHVWETEFDSLDDMAGYERDPAYQTLLADFWDEGGREDAIGRAALIAYETMDSHYSGDLLEVGRIRRLHLTTFASSAPETLIRKADEALLDMPAAIPEIKAWALGYNIARPHRGIPVYDHSWDTAFDDIPELQRYVTCDHHLRRTHDFAVRSSAVFAYEELQSCLYAVEAEMSGASG